MNGISTKQCPTVTPPITAMVCPSMLYPSGIGTNIDVSTNAKAMKNTEKYMESNSLLLMSIYIRLLRPKDMRLQALPYMGICYCSSPCVF